MNDSDQADSPHWPESERRQRVRRGEQDRRQSGQPAPSPDRRAADRRRPGDRRDEAGWIPVSLDAIVHGDETPDPLIEAAAAARIHAHARYSGFPVGAALETIDGRILTGCNIENATYGLTLCAERVALVKALSDGHEVFTRLAVVADTHTLTPPCGACRQLLWEYCGEIEVVLANFDGVRAKLPLASLLPLPFDGRLLE